MGQIRVQATAILNARPEDVYATIADYQQGHPRILPPKNLYDLKVEQGGYGEGTIIRFKARIWGTELAFRHRVSEPVPGRVLVEQDAEPGPLGVVTTFTVTPVGNGQQAQVEIASTMNASPGLRGWAERLLMPMGNGPVYRKELRLLESVARQRAQQAG
jgi:hypothetical protein